MSSCLTLDDLRAAFRKIERADPLLRVRMNAHTLDAVQREHSEQHQLCGRADMSQFCGVDLVETRLLPDGAMLLEYHSGRKVVRLADGTELTLQGVDAWSEGSF